MRFLIINNESLTDQSSVVPISVVVIAKNSARTLKDCLCSISRNRPKEIIVVDGGSNDDTTSIAIKFTQKILSDAGGGKSRARNLGAFAATQDYIAYVDSDVIIPDGALRVMLDELKRHNSAALTCMYMRNSASNPTYWSSSEETHNLYHRRWFHKLNLITACSLFPRGIIESYGFELAHGGFMDDWDLARRLQASKRQITISRVIPIHNKNQDTRAYISYHILLGKTHHAYFLKYGLAELRYFPALSMMFWIEFCIVHFKLRLIPYFFLKGLSESFGFISGPPSA